LPKDKVWGRLLEDVITQHDLEREAAEWVELTDPTHILRKDIDYQGFQDSDSCNVIHASAGMTIAQCSAACCNTWTFKCRRADLPVKQVVMAAAPAAICDEEWVELTDPTHILRKATDYHYREVQGGERSGPIFDSAGMTIAECSADQQTWRFKCRRADLPVKQVVEPVKEEFPQYFRYPQCLTQDVDIAYICRDSEHWCVTVSVIGEVSEAMGWGEHYSRYVTTGVWLPITAEQAKASVWVELTDTSHVLRYGIDAIKSWSGGWEYYETDEHHTVGEFSSSFKFWCLPENLPVLQVVAPQETEQPAESSAPPSEDWAELTDPLHLLRVDVDWVLEPTDTGERPEPWVVVTSVLEGYCLGNMREDLKFRCLCKDLPSPLRKIVLTRWLVAHPDLRYTVQLSTCRPTPRRDYIRITAIGTETVEIPQSK